MKKKLTALFLAMVTCLTMSVPAFAAKIPPDDLVMPCEDDTCPNNHRVPAGYKYDRMISGNSELDAQMIDDIIFISGYIPEIGDPISKTLTAGKLFSDWMDSIKYEGIIRADYKQYYYVKGTSLWVHTIWYHTKNGRESPTFCETSDLYISNR